MQSFSDLADTTSQPASMFLRVAVVAVLCGLIGSLDIPDTPDYQKCANTLFSQMKLKLATEMRQLNQTIAGVAGKFEAVCGGQLQQEGQIQVVHTSGPPPATAEDLSAMVTQLDRKLSDSQREIKRIVAVSAKKQDLKDSLVENNGILSHAIEEMVGVCATGRHVADSLAANNELLAETLGEAILESLIHDNETDIQLENSRKLVDIQTAVEGCLTKEQVEESLATTNTELTNIKIEITTTKEQVAESLANTNAELSAIKAEVTETKEGVEERLDFTNEALTTIKSQMTQLKAEAQEREDCYLAKIASLEEILAVILNATTMPPPTQAPQLTAQGTVYPCEDSTFPRNNYGVCESAVRFNKCYLETVAYHCCRTCTDNDMIPEMGPWRYRNDARVVNSLNVLRFFTL